MPLALLALACGRAEAQPADVVDSALRLAQASASSENDSELLLAVEVNAQAPADSIVVLRRADGTFWLPADSLARWRLRAPDATPLRHGGVSYFALASIAGARYSFDAASATLAITAAPEAFTGTQLSSAAAPYPPPTRPSPGGFVNYELFASRASGVSTAAAQLEAGLFSRYGVVTSGLLAQGGGGVRDTVRLDTTYTRDFPQRMETLRVGDTITFPGAWGRAVRIGGVQYGTNFATQPGFVTFPTVAANGQAALPSTVDVFVDNALVAHRAIAPGPFAITNIPTVSGSGNVQLVVRDLFGREQLISQPFYSTAQLLAPGLSQYSVEAGFERRNFGVDSDDYGPGVASATYQRGITPRLTGEARGEASKRAAAVGAAADWLVDDVGVVHGVLAMSRAAHDGNGALAGAGFERRTAVWTFAAQTQWTSQSYRAAGVSADTPLPWLQASATLGAQLGRYGSAGVTWIGQSFRDTDDVRVLSIGYTVSLGSFGFLNVAAVKTYGASGDVALTATLTVPLTSRDWASVSQNIVRASRNGNRDDTSATLQRNLPAGEGFGYRLVARSPSELTADLSYQNDVGTYELDATRVDGAGAVRASVAGGVGFIAAHAFASRAITESFGVVRVDDYDGVGVMLDNQPVARTGAGGYAVVPRLRAYDANAISVVERDLPLDAQVDRLRVEAIPYYRSGVLIEFPIRRSHGATFRLRLDDGGDMPAGALVDVIGGDAAFPVALGGEVYVTGLKARNRLRASWNGRSCEFAADLAATRDPLPDLGVIACRGVDR